MYVRNLLTDQTLGFNTIVWGQTLKEIIILHYIGTQISIFDWKPVVL